MPTYEYVCTKCDHAFEKTQSFSEASLTTCPNCGGELRKLYGAVGVVFKGSGFYRTDSRKAESSSTPSASSTKNVVGTPAAESTSTAPAAASNAPSTPSTSTKPSTAGTPAP